MANAPCDRAAEMSTSSTCFPIFSYEAFHSSAKGPVMTCFGRIPTFFCESHQHLDMFAAIVQPPTPDLMTSITLPKTRSFSSLSLPRTMTSTGILPPVRCSKCFAISESVTYFTRHQTRPLSHPDSPFFSVVIMYKRSSVKSSTVAGNS